MQNFEFHNPVKVVFGKGSIAELAELVPRGVPVLMTYGGGSIKRNGVYDEVKAALRGRAPREFGGIEPNPRYETLMRAVALARKERVKFLLAVGGGSVLDGTKFIAAAVPFKGRDPWDILAADAAVAAAVPLGCVLTLPATGSEMNGGAVISRESSREKLAFTSPLVYPRFSILDPATTFSLPKRQVTNGIVDAFVHVMEQYATYDVDAPLQDRQAEALLVTLMEEGPRTLKHPRDYEARANLVWCATQALNDLIGCGVPQDWATHLIGHELTALYGIDHAQSLAVVLPALLRHQRRRKRTKLLRYARRVMRLTGPAGDALILKAIAGTERFFRAVGMRTRLSEYGIPAEAAEVVAARLDRRGVKLGEHEDLGPKEVAEILRMCV
ncbi:MAG TPA: iron-containing alcohol dehydrogenase [Planctomycetota bacterium]|jgi:NADP-dependent alcohol dehydrogenase|nr:iron-containing alcohol dehydrogenase [Planctomycetota bacterium]OQC19724.1 MAG: Alcohol dehydrogenase YqhD [Planctomycetes bacterium ADurb.Bin069]HNR99849.1 iron-containing alcohol dehydrogenase [Planctomycetota bacterium]HNU25709.1 iron-containing alcohol dehydrogenase [Planctomycetota bacterium]HOE31059.1 iron-containing alcohol dehydrogenase [Planctomycetota bacterium]